MNKLLSGNEALALGAYHTGVNIATAYPGTPSTEILEVLSQFKDIYTEWSTNEKVAMEVALGACYTGARAMVSMKHVGLNVAADPFMAATVTGVKGGLVVIAADDPQQHSSQGEQDSRHFARMAKIPVLEPWDSQSAYDLMGAAFDISEQFDTPVMLRSTTRVSHSSSVVNVNRARQTKSIKIDFPRNMQKYVMLPVNARGRRPLLEKRLVDLAEFAKTFLFNRIEKGDRKIGIVANGVSYQYAREVFPNATFLKLGLTYPLSQPLLKQFATMVDTFLVIEELDPFLEENLLAMGIKVVGKEFIPRMGELNADIVESAGVKAGLLQQTPKPERIKLTTLLPNRPPLLCPGCPHSGIYYVLASMGQRLKLPGAKEKASKESSLVITGDIGCYTLGAYPPLNAMDTCACMGAGIGQAIGMEKAGLSNKVVAVIGDSTFLHSGITPLVDAVYNQSKITVCILDNSTTAMTGHQEHPGTGVSAQGKPGGKVIIEDLVKGLGIKDIKVLSAFDVKKLRAGVKDSLERDELSVVIVRGGCAVKVRGRGETRSIDKDICNQCGICLLIGCPAIQTEGKQPVINPTMCNAEACTICQQICPKQAIKQSLSIK